MNQFIFGVIIGVILVMVMVGVICTAYQREGRSPSVSLFTRGPSSKGRSRGEELRKEKNPGSDQ